MVKKVLAELHLPGPTETQCDPHYKCKNVEARPNAPARSVGLCIGIRQIEPQPEKALLAQLRQYIAQNSRRDQSRSRSASAALPRVSTSRKARNPNLRVAKASAKQETQACFGEPLQGCGGVIHHSSAAVGRDGYSKHERSLISLRALQTLDKDWVPPAALQSKIVGGRAMSVKGRKKGSLGSLLAP